MRFKQTPFVVFLFDLVMELSPIQIINSKIAKSELLLDKILLRNYKHSLLAIKYFNSPVSFNCITSKALLKEHIRK